MSPTCTPFSTSKAGYGALWPRLFHLACLQVAMCTVADTTNPCKTTLSQRKQVKLHAPSGARNFLYILDRQEIQ